MVYEFDACFSSIDFELFLNIKHNRTLYTFRTSASLEYVLLRSEKSRDFSVCRTDSFWFTSAITGLHAEPSIKRQEYFRALVMIHELLSCRMIDLKSDAQKASTDRHKKSLFDSINRYRYSHQKSYTAHLP